MNDGQTVNTTQKTMAAAERRDHSSRRGFGLDKLFLILVVLYLIVPLGATLAFGLSNGKSIDFSTYQQIFSDPNLSATLVLSLGLAFTATILGVVLVTPTAYWVHLRLPQARPLMDFLSLVPFAVPAIVLSLGLVEVYGSNNTVLNVLSFGLVPLLSNPPLQHRQYGTSTGMQLCNHFIAVRVPPYRQQPACNQYGRTHRGSI